MLIVICGVPVLIALLFGFGVPELEAFLCQTLEKETFLSDYYLLFDLFMAMMTPFMLTFVSSMVILTELDENMAAYLAVTPITKKGYIISRLVFPAALSGLISVVLLGFFSLSHWSFGSILLAALLSSLLSIPVAMVIVTFSHNRVEGMAIAKLSGLILLGLPAPFFLKGGFQFLFSWLPSFWMSKLFLGHSIWSIFFAIGVSMIWIWMLYRRFERKMI